MRSIALFGGSFNPPHSSHLGVLRFLTGDPSLEEIWLVPAFRHPFGKSLAPFDDRMAMCGILAAEAGAKVCVCDVEREVPGQGHTINMVRELRLRYPEVRFRLVLGSDIRAEADRWRDFPELERLAPILWIPRSGWEDENRILGAAVFLGPESSTEVRRRVARGLPIDDLVPEKISAYIRDHGLYRTGRPGETDPEASHPRPHSKPGT